MPAATLNLEVEQGSTFDKTLTWKTSALALINLTGYTARMQIRQKVTSPDIILSLTTENGGITLGGTLGTIRIFITAVQTAGILVKSASYDLELVRTVDGYVTRLVEGKVTISPEVTR